MCGHTTRFQLLAPFGGSPALLVSVVAAAKPVGAAVLACRHHFATATKVSQTPSRSPGATGAG
jgi:hypothetical protein